MSELPKGWASDSLSSFFDVARNNLLASFANLRGEYSAIRDIDAAFLALLEGWTDPESIGPAPLAFRAHSAFRVAAQLALSGQVPEAFMVMRGCLENALYANHIDSAAAALDAWLKRADSEAARKRCVSEFAGRNLFGSLRSRDGQLGDMVGKMYERTIDYGAHPNESAVLGSMTVEEGEEHTGYVFAYVTGDGLPLRFALRTLAQVGLMTLDILCLVFPKRASEKRIQDRLKPIKPHF